MFDIMLSIKMFFKEIMSFDCRVLVTYCRTYASLLFRRRPFLSYQLKL